MAVTVNQNFTKHKGDDIVIQVPVDDVVSLENFTLRWVMCPEDPEENPNSPILLDKQNTGGNPEIYTVENVAFIALPSNQTDNQSSIAAGSYYHELHGLDGDGEGGVMATGTATFLPTRIGR